MSFFGKLFNTDKDVRTMAGRKQEYGEEYG